MLKFEDQVPNHYRTSGVIVKSVGELIDALQDLPKELPLSGYYYNGSCRVMVIERSDAVHGDRLACDVDEYDPDDAWFDEEEE